MKRASKFLIPPNWQVLFSDLGVDLSVVLKHAQLPAELFFQDKVYLTPPQYFQLWQGIEAASGDIDIPLRFAEIMTLESFDVPIFAAICCDHLVEALNRLRQYKPLIGPMVLSIDNEPDTTRLSIQCYGYDSPLPGCFLLIELVFFTQLARLATRHPINPSAVYLPELPKNTKPYEDYFGCSLLQAEQASICFNNEDAHRPFLTRNQAMLTMFETEIAQRLAQSKQNESITEKVSEILVKTLPQGQSNIGAIAEHLALSKRSLQRKLTEENKTFQEILKDVRSQLADHYLTKTNIPLIEISFLLGFSEFNSFIRAYNGWTGSTPMQTRNLFIN